MAQCTFCGTIVPRGTGKLYVKTDGKIFTFCSMKCEKNMIKLKRKARTTTWTKEYADIKAGAKATAETAKPSSKKAAAKPKK